MKWDEIFTCGQRRPLWCTCKVYHTHTLKKFQEFGKKDLGRWQKRMTKAIEYPFFVSQLVSWMTKKFKFKCNVQHFANLTLPWSKTRICHRRTVTLSTTAISRKEAQITWLKIAELLKLKKAWLHLKMAGWLAAINATATARKKEER